MSIYIYIPLRWGGEDVPNARGILLNIKERVPVDGLDTSRFSKQEREAGGKQFNVAPRTEPGGCSADSAPAH